MNIYGIYSLYSMYIYIYIYPLPVQYRLTNPSFSLHFPGLSPQSSTIGLQVDHLRPLRRAKNHGDFQIFFDKDLTIDTKTGWWYVSTPLKNMSSSIEMMTFPIKK